MDFFGLLQIVPTGKLREDSKTYFLLNLESRLCFNRLAALIINFWDLIMLSWRKIIGSWIWLEEWSRLKYRSIRSILENFLFTKMLLSLRNVGFITRFCANMSRQNTYLRNNKYKYRISLQDVNWHWLDIHWNIASIIDRK